MREEESSEMRESQMQMLYVIGRLAERSAPFAYFHFDGEGEGLALDPRGKFPSSNTGYTFMCWLQADRFFDVETPLLTLGDKSGPAFFELLFLVDPKNQPVRSLAVRSRQGTYVFRRSAIEAGTQEWRHLVMCHHREQLYLLLDGVLLSTFDNVAYPSVTKSGPIAKIGTAVRAGAGAFCGSTGTLLFLEGILTRKAARALYEIGTLSQLRSDLRGLGVLNKQFLACEPQGEGVTTIATSPAASPPTSPSRRASLLEKLAPKLFDDSATLTSRGGGEAGRTVVAGADNIILTPFQDHFDTILTSF
jgi:hypothetical protein